MPPPITVLDPNHPDYPTILGHGRTVDPVVTLHAIGDTTLLHRRYLGLFSSVKCPGDAILRAYDLARELRDAGIPVIGGFHSPMEKECLSLLLRGRQPVIVVPARGIEGMRVPPAWQPAIDGGRLLVLSPFGSAHRRATVALAERRNAIVEALSAALLVVHAAPGGRTERFALAAATAGKPVLLATAAGNTWLEAAGASRADIAVVRTALDAAR